MRTANIFQNIVKQEKAMTKSGLSFRPGQIINGKVLKLFPNQIAQVQVGSEKVIAQLEVGLSVDDRYWFQVQSGEGKVHLRVLESPNGKQPTVENLLKQLNLPTTKENISLVQFFLKEQLPITKDMMHKVAEWLKGSQSFQEGLQSVRLLLTKNLPFTKDVFHSVSSFIKNESLSMLLENLQTELNTNSSTETVNRLSTLLTEMTMNEKDKQTQLALTKLLKEWLGSVDPLKSKTAFNLLQNLGFIPSDANEEGLIHLVTEKWMNVDGKLAPQMKNSSSGMETKAVNEIQRILSNVRLNNQSVSLNEKDLTRLTTAILRSQDSSALMNQVLSTMKTEGQPFIQLAKAMKMDYTQLSASFSNDEQALLTNITKEVQLTAMQWEDSNTVKEQIKHLIRSMGFTYEHDMLNVLKNQEGESINKMETLKPLLMGLLSEELPVPMKDAAERLLYKITGFQVLSQEIGPIQQYVFQIPLSFLEMKSDLTMQWSGRKTKEGKIDPNFCRVLFYLDLNYLRETIVDLQVQNKVMNISIVNEREDLKMLVAPFVSILKENLAKINYQLSSITFEKPVENKQKKNATGALSTNIIPRNLNGVDFRI